MEMFDIKAEATSFKDFVIAIKIFLLNSVQKNLWHVLGQEKIRNIILIT